MAQVQYQGVARYLVLVYLLLLVCLWPRASFDKNSFCSHESNILLLLFPTERAKLTRVLYQWDNIMCSSSLLGSCRASHKWRHKNMTSQIRWGNDVTKIWRPKSAEEMTSQKYDVINPLRKWRHKNMTSKIRWGNDVTKIWRHKSGEEIISREEIHKLVLLWQK
jgi:hypothetical protein